MNKIKKYLEDLPPPAALIITGVLLGALIHVPISASVSLPKLEVKKAYVEAGSIIDGNTALIAEAFFGSETPIQISQAITERQMNFVSSRKAYPASLAVIKKHENTIKTKAREKNVPEDVAIGVSLLENGGSETAVSSAGALGVFQLMPGTARNLGLTVNKKVDERRNPEKNIDAGVTYLKKNYDRFGDWGLSTWAYHAGEGNVSKALKIYAKANHGIELPGVKESHVLRAYVEKYGITIHKLLSDPSVQKMTKKLNDDSSGYPYKVVATATLFKKDKDKSHGQTSVEAEVVAR
ncbi:MAG: lytic transglycosylase domain-containing protein [bacterium]|nr:lytic transglycosylase domain-containing protein [bacterium]